MTPFPGWNWLNRIVTMDWTPLLVVQVVLIALAIGFAGGLVVGGR